MFTTKFLTIYVFMHYVIHSRLLPAKFYTIEWASITYAFRVPGDAFWLVPTLYMPDSSFVGLLMTENLNKITAWCPMVGTCLPFLLRQISVGLIKDLGMPLGKVAGGSCSSVAEHGTVNQRCQVRLPPALPSSHQPFLVPSGNGISGSNVDRGQAISLWHRQMCIAATTSHLCFTNSTCNGC